jgi:hypothetical protein
MTDAPTPRRVFVSHASEDKAFVIPLATRLRADGVEAWVDTWEILAGDSLADRIFEQGIANCDVFLIVLSTLSVTKPWVREELNAGFALRVEKATRLMAVRLDDCEVPVVLKSRLWIDMSREGDNDDDYRRLLNAIHLRHERPPLGPDPFADVSTVDPKQTPDEATVMRLFLSEALAGDPRKGFSPTEIASKCGLSIASVREAVEVLESDRDLGVTRFAGGHFHAALTASGWLRHAAMVGIDATEDARRILAQVASSGPSHGQELVSSTGLSRSRVILGIGVAEMLGYVQSIRALGSDPTGLYHVTVTGTGKKALR